MLAAVAQSMWKCLTETVAACVAELVLIASGVAANVAAVAAASQILTRVLTTPPTSSWMEPGAGRPPGRLAPTVAHGPICPGWHLRCRPSTPPGVRVCGSRGRRSAGSRRSLHRPLPAEIFKVRPGHLREEG